MTVKEYIDTYFESISCKDTERYNTLKKQIIEYNKDLIKRYPWLEPTNRWTGKHLEDYDYSYTELDDLPSGWRIRFGNNIVEEINSELEKFNFVNNYRILQIKEKYGTLRWYDEGTPIGKLSETFDEIVCPKIQSRNGFPQYNSKEYYWEENEVEHYISPFSDKAKAMRAKELSEYNKGAIVHYKIYRIEEKCRIPDIIRKYEEISAITCIMCGKPAKWMSRGWISLYCDECAKSMIKHSIEKISDINDYFSEIN